MQLETCGLKVREDDLVVGYANTPIVDRGDAQYRDYIPAELWLEAIVLFFQKGAPINVMHRNIPGGETVSVDVTPNGPLLVTRPTKQWVAQAIAGGDLKGYSIEYYIPEYRVIQPGTDEYRALLNDPLETRAIRYAVKILLVRVSYVDEPMNQGSYFLGGKALDLSKWQFRFDREKGELTVFARTDEAMAELAGMLADEFKASRPDVPVRGISFKFESDEPQHEADGRRGGLFGRLASALGKELPDEEEAVNGEVKAQYDGLKADLDAVVAKVAAIEAKGDGVKAEDIAAIKASVDGLIAALPKPEAKTLGERVAALGETPALAALSTEVAGMKASLADLGSKLEALTATVDKVGAKSTAMTPTATPEAKGAAGDPWGPGGTGASIYAKGSKQ